MHTQSPILGKRTWTGQNLLPSRGRRRTSKGGSSKERDDDDGKLFENERNENWLLQVPAAPLAVAAPPAVEWIPGGILVPSSPRPLGPQGSTRGHRITTVVAPLFSSVRRRAVTRIVRPITANATTIRPIFIITSITRRTTSPTRPRAGTRPRPTVSPPTCPLRARRRASAARIR